MNPVIEAVLLNSAVLLLIVGNLAGLLVGALLLWHPRQLRKVGNILNRWVSTRHMNQALDRTFALEPWFYRHRRLSGWLILLSSSYILYTFTAGLNRDMTVAGFSRRFSLPPGVVGGLLDAIVLSALLGALLAVFVGLFLLLRPSMLREFEQGANRWVSLRRGLKPLEVRHEGVDEYVYKHARQIGVVLVLGSLYALALLTRWISHYH